MQSIGIIGFGWLGKPTGVRLRIMNEKVSAITSSAQRLQEIEALGIAASHIDLNTDYSAELFDWLEDKDVIVFAISPSKLNDYVEVVANISAMLNPEQKMVFISSTSVYDDSLKVVDETSPVSPSKRSGSTLIDAEKLLYKKLGKRLSIIRMGGLVGGDRQPAKYFSGKTNVKGGWHPTNFIHKEDAVHLIFHVIMYELYGEIINGVCSSHVLKRDYYPHALEMLGMPGVSFDESDKSSAKIVSNYKSLQLGMWYKYENPMQFPELLLSSKQEDES